MMGVVDESIGSSTATTVRSRTRLVGCTIVCKFEWFHVVFTWSGLARP